MRILTKRTPLLAIGAALALSGCIGDGDAPLAARSPAVGGDLFARYISMGNSLTAGFQSGGLNDSLQVRAYPVLLAQKAQAAFNAPLVRSIPGAPGSPCPAPMIAPFTPGPTPTGGCARITTPRFVSNLAVPGERIGDLVSFNPSSPIAGLHTLLIGPKSQLQTMRELDPTLLSVWIGNNDALSAALGGRLGPAAAGADSTLTPLSAFNASLATLVDGIAQEIDTGAGEDAILIGVVDAVTASPLVQPGAFFFLARDVAGNFNGKPVNNNCSPVDLLGNPNPLAANMVSFLIVSSAIPEINCDPAQAAGGGAYLLDASEIAVVRARVAQYNAGIQAAAAAHGWIYLDPNAFVAPYLAERDAQGRFQRDRKCQLLPTARTAAEFQAAVLLSCPVPPTGATAPYAAPNMVGTLLSYDATHLSTEGQRLIANGLAALINAKHGTTLSTN